MHLIVDIRSRHPEDAVIIRYAQNWTKKWKKYNLHDTCTFLIFDQQEAPGFLLLKKLPPRTQMRFFVLSIFRDTRRMIRVFRR